MSNASNNPDPERLLRIRQRIPALRVRHRILQSLRQWFNHNNFCEVETPTVLTTVAPELHITPARCENGLLATSPELQMKQLAAAGMSPIYQFARSFRQGELGSLHAPEFTLLEWYRDGTTLEPLMRDLEGLFLTTAENLNKHYELNWQGSTIDLSAPWPVTTVQEAFTQHAGWDPVADFDADRFDLDLATLVEPHLGTKRPEFLVRYPLPVGSLARTAPDDPRVCLRMELYIAGIELANGFVELNNPVEQRRRFEDEAEAIHMAGRIPPPMPEAFLATLSDLPETVGIALGIDRMAMLFADVPTIHDVRTFTPNEA
jgi:elongation factor P--(R)-beta-lysine ligase